MTFSEHENTVLVIRRHPVIFFARAAFFFLLATLPLILLLPGVQQAFESFDPFILSSATIILELFMALFIFYSFFEYFLDEWIVTDTHIINIEQKSFFARNIAKQEIARIQDIETELKGIFGTIFGYGNIYIQTAGKEERIAFTQVPNPQYISDTILKLAEQLNTKNPSSEGDI